MAEDTTPGETLPPPVLQVPDPVEVGKTPDQMLDAGAPPAEPACDVVFSLDRDGNGERSLVIGNGHAPSARIVLWVTNPTKATQTLRMQSPVCPAPAQLLGIPEGYDAFDACRAAACPADAATRLVLPPGQRAPIGIATLSTEPSQCNRAGVSPGIYPLRFAVGDLPGLRVCGPEVFELRVE